MIYSYSDETIQRIGIVKMQCVDYDHQFASRLEADWSKFDSTAAAAAKTPRSTGRRKKAVPSTPQEKRVTPSLSAGGKSVQLEPRRTERQSQPSHRAKLAQQQLPDVDSDIEFLS